MTHRGPFQPLPFCDSAFKGKKVWFFLWPAVWRFTIGGKLLVFIVKCFCISVRTQDILEKQNEKDTENVIRSRAEYFKFLLS